MQMAWRPEASSSTVLPSRSRYFTRTPTGRLTLPRSPSTLRHPSQPSAVTGEWPSISGLIRMVRGKPCSPWHSMTTTCSERNTCGAARPIPSTLTIVSSRSSMNSWKARLPIFSRRTGSATCRNTGAPSFAILRTAIVQLLDVVREKDSRSAYASTVRANGTTEAKGLITKFLGRGPDRFISRGHRKTARRDHDRRRAYGPVRHKLELVAVVRPPPRPVFGPRHPFFFRGLNEVLTLDHPAGEVPERAERAVGHAIGVVGQQVDEQINHGLVFHEPALRDHGISDRLALVLGHSLQRGHRVRRIQPDGDPQGLLAHRRYFLFIGRHRVEDRHRRLVLDHGHRFDRIDPNTPARMPNAFGEDRNGRWPDVDELSDRPELLLAIQQRDEGFCPLCLLLGQGERGRHRPKRQDQRERDY